MDKYTNERLLYECGYRDGFHAAIKLMNEQTEQLMNKMKSLEEDKLKYGKYKEENGDC